MADHRTQLKQIFRYIRALVERKLIISPSYSDYSFNLELFDLPQHEKVSLECRTSDDISLMGNVIVRVGKAEVPACPDLPPVLSGWVESGWDNPMKSCKVIDKREFLNPDTELFRTELFSDDANRRDQFTDWLALRDEWAQEAQPAARARELYDTLYALYSRLEREKDRLELVIGDALLSAIAEDGAKINHPLILERVALEFDASVPEFIISDTDSPATLFTRLLRMVNGIETACLSELSAELESKAFHAYDGEELDAFISKMCNRISSESEFVPDGHTSDAKIQVHRGLVLFIRSKNSGYIAIVDKILEDLETTNDISPSLLGLIGGGEDSICHTVVADTAASLLAANGLDSEVLLEKSANREQLLIAHKIAENHAVLVQGPPGTGKTHTISNIIGDLLSRGLSVLVTSQTSKALDVLRDKISEPIRPLCVSVLDNNRQQLEQSLNSINDYMSAHNVESLLEDGERLQNERNSVIAQLLAAKQQLVELVELEYTDIPLDGKVYSPKEAGQLIADVRSGSFIPDEVSLDSKLPLSEEELETLYATNISLTPEQETVLALNAPDTEELLSKAEMARLFAIVTSSQEELTSDGVGFWRDNAHRDAEALGQLCADLKRELQLLISAESWQLSLAQSGIAQGGVSGVYSSIKEGLAQLNALYAEIRSDIIDTDPRIPQEIITSEMSEIFADMLEDIDTEKINWLKIALHPKWKPILENCVINGEKPDTRSEVEILSRYHQYLLGQQSLVKRWNKALVSLGAPGLPAERPEEPAQKIWSTIEYWLTWYANRWLPLSEHMNALGFEFDRYSTTIPLEVRMNGEVATAKYALEHDLITLCEIEYSRGDRSESLEVLEERAKQLLPWINSCCAEFGAMHSAILARDIDAYRAAFDSYDIICMKRSTYTTRIDLLERLEMVCPKWAAQIVARDGLNGEGKIPGDLVSCWLCARLCGELNERAGNTSTALQKKIAKLEKQLSTLTRDLISARAWCAQLQTMQTGEKKRALASWVNLVKRVGKGTGKRAEQLLASGELRRAMKACRRSVPVWIMPLPSVAEYFEPGDEKFDVLIIDEASQADLSGLIALYMAKKVIVVGDDKQVSPTPVGMDLETSQKLKQEFLRDVDCASLLDELTSIYDLGKANYEPITLREHFRCVTDIINFSNHHTYNGIICPLRDAGSIPIKPATVAYHVEDGAPTGRKTNMREALACTALIKACCEQREYDGSTFGVITMIGDEQGVLIDRLLREKLNESEYQARQILCGNPAYFQGDERDVIFISLVDAPSASGKALQVRREGYNEVYAKRYNVAASRARDQMWVLHSINPNTDLKADDLRYKLIDHAAHPEVTAEILHSNNGGALSPMEQYLSDELTARGYCIDTRERVGNYLLSMICSGGGKRVAIECDGERDLDEAAIAEEMTKQSVLERLGWKFLRIRSSEFYRDRESVLAWLLTQLDEAGVVACGETRASDNSLLERVTERAKELLAQWEAETDSSDAADETEETDEAEKVFGSLGTDSEITF